MTTAEERRCEANDSPLADETNVYLAASAPVFERPDEGEYRFRLAELNGQPVLVDPEKQVVCAYIRPPEPKQTRDVVPAANRRTRRHRCINVGRPRGVIYAAIATIYVFIILLLFCWCTGKHNRLRRLFAKE